MSKYEYYCSDCDEYYDIEHPMKETGRRWYCPKCWGLLYRVYSLGAVIFKGPGFYKTDNRKSNET